MREAPKPHLEGLNPAQLKAVTWPGHTLAVACPGSGKTRVLTVRTADLLLRSKANSVCAVTFTKDSAVELGHRIAQFVSEDDRRRVISGTFHALALKQLQSARKKIKLLGPGEQRSLIGRAIDASHPQLDFEIACKHIEHMKSSLTPIAESKMQEEVYRAYQSLLDHLHAHDFQDLMIQAVLGMRDGSVAPLAVSHLLVDEYQDADFVQHEWVNAHASAGAIITVVGDDDQSLYGWRNALGYQGMRQFQLNHCAELVTLDTNYRSRREILALGEQLILRNEERLPKSLRTHQGPGGQIYSRRFYKREEEMDAMVDEVRESPAQWAIIARTNAILNHVQAALDADGIPYRRVGGANFWNSPAPNALLMLLGSVANGHPLGAEHALHYTGADSSALAQIHRTRGLSAQSHDSAPTGNNEVDDFAGKLRKWRQQSRSGLDDLVVIAATSWLAGRIKGKKNIERLELARRVFERLQGNLEKRVRAIQRRKEDKEQEPGASILTMHASKGLEFDHVWIAGMEADICPHVDNPVIEEERRLFYVGITRARVRLVVSSASGEGNPSCFLVEVGMADPPSAASLAA